ncbi:unnamed protein product [Caenorhabditis nigoni]
MSESRLSSEESKDDIYLIRNVSKKRKVDHELDSSKRVETRDEDIDPMEESGDDFNAAEKKSIKTDRNIFPKRDRNWIRRLENDGKILVAQRKKKSKYDNGDTTSLIHYIYEDGRPFEYVLCSYCEAILSSTSGGHWTKHQKKSCMIGSKTNRSEVKECQDEVRTAIVEFCISSGASFRQTESKSFRKLIRTCMSSMLVTQTIIQQPTIILRNGVIPVDDIKLTCRQTVRDSVQKRCLELQNEIGEKIRTYVLNGNATIILDFGLHVHNYLSSFISFIVTNEFGVPSLQILPFSFTPMFVVKTSENVRDEILRRGSKYGLTRSQVLSLGVISDGAKNVNKMGEEYFSSWALCACHALQKMSERILSPKVSNKFMYTDEELESLEKCSALLKKCAKMALLIHKKKREIRISRLPTVYIDTRWQSCVKCAKDVESLLPFLRMSRVSIIADLAEEITEEIHVLKSSIEALDRFEPLLSFFEVDLSKFVPFS